MGEKRDGSSGFGQGEKKNARRRKGRPLQLEGGERECVAVKGRSLVVEWKTELDDDLDFLVRHYQTLVCQYPLPVPCAPRA